jgi:hypothetical protein
VEIVSDDPDVAAVIAGRADALRQLGSEAPRSVEAR